MYCCGSNEYGQLGIGETTGMETPAGYDHPIPKFYAKTFTAVGGSGWMQVRATADKTWALKTDGSLWFAGEGTNTFVAATGGPFVAMLVDGSLIKDAGDNYEFWTPGGASPDMTVTKAQWASLYGAGTPREVAAATEGAGVSGITFIGGGFVDITLSTTEERANKERGSLWGLSEIYQMEAPGTDWVFTSGFPSRNNVPDGPIIGGATIAIKR